MRRMSKATRAFFQRLSDEYRNAPVIEVNEPFGDSFETGSDCMPTSHESREAAKAYALRILMC